MPGTETPAPKDEQRQDSRTRRRRWWFRCAAILFGLSLFAIVELVCLVFDWGRPAEYPDPYVGFHEIHPLFIPDATGTRYTIAPARQGFFAPDSFPIEKQENTFRVFCLGGSTVQGRPYSRPTAFGTWMQLSLNAGDPRRNWEVVNCGGISYASYRLIPILRECLTYRPDLIVLCTGHNEFLEERTYHHVKHAPKYVSIPARVLARSRTFTLLRSAVLKATGRDSVPTSENRPTLNAKVDALLDYNGGIKAYHRDDAWRAGVVEHFEYNVRKMVRMANQAGVPIVIVLPPSNLRDCPPFKSEHVDGLPAGKLAEWESLVSLARSNYRSDLRKSVDLFEQALAIDDRYAKTYYELGQCCDLLWQRTAEATWKQRAVQAYLRAREEDICPLRMIAPLESALRTVAAETGTPLIDAHRLLEAETRDGILGNGLLVDHVHPSPIRGHQLLCAALTTELERQGFFRPAADWRTKRDAAFRRHQQSLNNLYFAHGQRTLKALRAWAAGRADGPPIESRKRADSK